MCLVYSALKIHDTFCQAVFFADVLQKFNTNVRDADAVRHEVCLNKHFVVAAFLVFDELQRHSVNSAKAVELIVLCQVYVSLGNRHLFS